MAALSENPRAYHIPSVREHEHSRPVMKLSELFSFFGLYAHIHRKPPMEGCRVNKDLEPKVLPYLAKQPIWRGILPAGFSQSASLNFVSPSCQNFRQNYGLIVFRIFRAKKKR